MPQDAPIVSNLTNDSATLTWKPAEDVSDVSYIIEMKLPDTDWQPVDTVTEVHAKVNVDPTCEVKFRIRAKNQFGASDPTKEAVIDKRAGPPNKVEKSPKCDTVDAKTVKLSWKAVKNVKGFIEVPITYDVEKR